jgi:coenzyme Q-binding protein COQ10
MPKQIYNISTCFRVQDLFDIVADVESYPEFLPFVSAARIESAKDDIIIAQLVIKYKIFRSCYTSRIKLIRPQEIIVELVEGPFKHLKNYWKFIEEPEGSRIEFMIDFELKSSFLEELVSSEFDKYAKKLMDAFIKRAESAALKKIAAEIII